MGILFVCVAPASDADLLVSLLRVCLMATTSTIELNRLRRPPPLAAVRFFTEEQPSPSPHGSTDNFAGPNAYEEESLAIHPLWKRNLYQLLEQPTSSPSAFVVHMFITFLIVLSAFVTVLETVPAVHSISTNVWFGVETSVVALFTVEYVTRCLAWSGTWSSLFSWMFCALYPLLVEPMHSHQSPF